jgi:hypothetical protein
MAPPNGIVDAATAFGKEHGFRKKYRTWWRRQEETIAVYNVQGSAWGPQFYINVGLWLLPLEETESPAIEWCHIRTRLGTLIERAVGIDQLLDLSSDIPDTERTRKIIDIFNQYMLPAFNRCTTIDALLDPGNPMLSRSLVLGVAQEFIEQRRGSPDLSRK